MTGRVAPGGNRSEWYADTTSDVEEALAYHLLRDSSPCFWIPFETADRATEMTAALAPYGLGCPPDSMTRGGVYLYSFRVRMWNAHTIRTVPADYKYRPPMWRGLLR